MSINTNKDKHYPSFHQKYEESVSFVRMQLETLLMAEKREYP